VWSIGDPEPEPAATITRPDCPGCGEPDLVGDDFCHECGHAFEHFGAVGAVLEEAEQGAQCPICAAGELTALEYGRTQCDSCGYTPRDEG